MARTMQAKTPSSANAAKKKARADPAVKSATAQGTKRRGTGPRTSLSQCGTMLLLLYRRVANEESAASDTTKPLRLSQRARDHVCFLLRGMEQQLFGQCRKLMRTRTMSPKLLTTSMFLSFDKDIAQQAAVRAFRARTKMDQLDREFQEECERAALNGTAKATGKTKKKAVAASSSSN